jgi:hypothetical protein
MWKVPPLHLIEANGRTSAIILKPVKIDVVRSGIPLFIWMNTLSAVRLSTFLQGEHKITVLFQNDTENKCGVLRNSHLHQSIEKLSKFCTHLTETRYVLRESHGRCRNDNPTRPKLFAVCP